MKVNLKMNPAIETSITFTDEEEVTKPRLGINYEGHTLYTPMGLGWYGSLKGLYNNIYSGQHPALLGKSHKEEEGETGGAHVSCTTEDFSTWNCVLQISPEFWNDIDQTITNIAFNVELDFIDKSTRALSGYIGRTVARHLSYGDTGTFEVTVNKASNPELNWCAIRLLISIEGRQISRFVGCAQDFSGGKVGDVFAVSMPTYSYTDPLITFTFTKTYSGRNLTVNVTRLEPEDSYEFGYYRGSEWVKLNDFSVGTTTTTLPDEILTGTIFVPQIYMKRTNDDKVILDFSTSSTGSWYSSFYADSMAHNAIFE